MSRYDEKGRRLSIWISEENLWVFQVLSKLQIEYEKKGLPISRADICRDILIRELEKKNEKADDHSVSEEGRVAV